MQVLELLKSCFITSVTYFALPIKSRYFVTPNNTKTTMSIGNNIKLFRNKLGLNQADIAEFCGISRELISFYENNAREVSLLHLEKISEYLNIDIDVFFEDDPQELKPELALAFRAEELSPADRANVAHFKTIVKNFLKMKTIANNGTQA